MEGLNFEQKSKYRGFWGEIQKNARFKMGYFDFRFLFHLWWNFQQLYDEVFWTSVPLLRESFWTIFFWTNRPSLSCFHERDGNSSLSVMQFYEECAKSAQKWTLTGSFQKKFGQK